MRLDEITTPVVARFRADLVAKKLGDKRINNILAGVVQADEVRGLTAR
jgi:hypothetical protein